MEPYLVSARKYRPLTFDSVVGQGAITTTLKNAIRNEQLAQAFLFCGPRGVGKTTCARILARTINCFNPSSDMEACGTCESCVSFANNASYNIYELDAASNNSVEDIRTLVDQVRIPPQVGKYKIYIIDEVHMLSSSAFNAFLKTLEEPPSYAKFILATTERHKILPTILSRCQIFDFKRIKVEDMTRHLAKIAAAEKVTFEEPALHVIAQKADGGLRDALSMFDQLVSYTAGNLSYQAAIENLNILDYEYYFRLMDAALDSKIPDLLAIFNEIMERGFDGQHFLNGLGAHLRDLMVCKDPQTVVLLEVAEAVKSRYLEQSQRCEPLFIVKSLDLINRCDVNYRNSNNRRLSIEILLMQIGSFFLVASDEWTNVEAAPIIAPATSFAPQEPTQVIKAEVSAAISSPLADRSESSSALQPSAPSAPPEAAPQMLNETPRISKSLSIKERMRQGKQQQEIEIEQKETCEAFDLPCVEKAWKAYIDSLDEKQTYIRSVLSAALIALEQTTLVVTVSSAVQALEVESDSQEILTFIRAQVRNTSLLMKVLVDAESSPSHFLTLKETYGKLCEINPELETLRNTFSLDLSY